MSKVIVTHRANGISVLEFSNPPVNALSSALQTSISKSLKSVLARAETRAVVIYGSGSKGFFSSGADVSEFSSIAEGKSPFSRESSWCYSGAEDAPVPVVAAIDGICFGGALELALCCSARVSTATSSFSLPELKLGIIPGLGGTQRLPRLIGFQKGVEAMLKSTVFRAQDALQIGLVDSVITGDLLEAATAYAAKIADGRIPRVKVIEKTDVIGDLLSCRAVATELKKKLVPKLSKGGRLPHYNVLVDVALYGVKHGGREGIREEARAFLELVTSASSRGIVHMFFATRKTSKVQITNDPNPNKPGKAPKTVGVIGGGLMGAGIAAAMLSANITVIIKELNEKFALSARKRVEKNLGLSGQSKMVNLSVTTEYKAIAHVDMVIEAALENPKLKQEIFSALEATCRPDCILATNTSTLNLDLIGMGAPKAHREGRIIGAHFFSPAHKMPLLEIVRTESTSPNVIKDVLAFGKKIKKTSVLVGNCAGFAVNRMYFPQSMVAGYLVSHFGIDPYRIDTACEAFGLPMGPFRLVDLVGLDIGAAVGGVFSTAFAERAVGVDVVTNMLAAGRKGQKSGAGFYRYKHGSRVGVPVPDEILPFLKELETRAKDEPGFNELRSRGSRITDADIVHMILLACVNEGCRILDEGVAISSSDLDVCSVMGMGFPPFHGGLMYWAQKSCGGALGVSNKLEYFLNLSNGFPLFKPSLALLRSARRNGSVGEIFRPPLSSGAPDDIVIVSAFRTAVGRASRGGFKDTLPDNLLVPVIERILEDTRVDPSEIGDVITGTVLQRSDTGIVQLRVAGLLSGLPHTVPVRTTNRLCSSGLQAIAEAAAAIQAGHQNIIIAGGIESMSKASMKNTEVQFNPSIKKKNSLAVNCYISMGETSENVAEAYGISRERQDKLAVCSHARASVAKLAGRQRSEIVPVQTKVQVIDKETKKVTGTKNITVDGDEGVRLGVTMNHLAKLPAVFRKGGSTTPGNSSQLSDGAALVMMMKRSEAMNRGLEPLAALRSYAVVGVDPKVMGIGPVFAIPQALEKAGITIEDVDLFEINEAFGSQADYCIEKLGLNRDIVNVMGGAIAIGHPLGMTGARLTVSIIHELHRRGGRYGVVSMCVGTGMGAAAVYEICRPTNQAKM